MKRTLSAVSGIILIVTLISCGGYLSTDTSLVTITIGDDQTASIRAEKTTMFAKLWRLLDKVQVATALAYIPDFVETVKVTVGADDTETIIMSESENVFGQSSVSITLEVPNGISRHFTIESMDDVGNVIYIGYAHNVDLNGEPVSLSVDMFYVGDSTFPNFGGLASASGNGSTGIDLTWTAATDNLSASSEITYLIYMSTTSGGQDFTIPDVITSPGATTYTVTGLNPSTVHYFVVRARDKMGNIDGNIVEYSATQDIIAPTFGGSGPVTAVSTTGIDLAWTAATDDETASLGIEYLIYVSLSSSGQDFSSPNFVTTPGATTYSVTGLSPTTDYYFVVRARDEAGNVDSNTVEYLATTLTPADVILPTFGGLLTATAAASTLEIDLGWTDASDDTSLPADIVYLVYISTISGGQNFAVPDFTTTAGLTSYTVTGLQSATEYFIVVKARDEAGNVDTNTTELSATTPDTQPPAFGGVATATAILGGKFSPPEIDLTWTAATDDVTASINIVYLVYMSTTSGGQNFTAADFTTSAGVTTYTVTGLSSSTTYYFVVRARDEAGNIDGNTIEKSATTSSGSH